jgi:signal transduction histidine kinase
MEKRRLVGRLNRTTRGSRVVVLGLAGFVVGVYLVVVLGGGALIGRTGSPSLLLSVVATAVVALLFARVQTAIERFVSRRGPASTAPYDVLSRFSDAVTRGYTSDDLPARMSMLLAQGTGAQWAQVWLSVSGQLTLAATWPSSPDATRTPPDPQPGAVDASGEGRRALTVLHGGEALGVLRLQERPGLRLTAVEERLFSGLAAQAGLVLRLVGLRAQLEGRHEELVARARELRASRERVIATQDVERRRLERDLHDGAQQHLVALSVNLRLAQTVAPRSPERAGRVLAAQAAAADDAIETLSSLSRGIYPRQLSAEGLVPALRAAAKSQALPVVIGAGTLERLPGQVEAALYFCCMEAVQNATKHSGAARVDVSVDVSRRTCRLTVTDTGRGFDQTRLRAGTGLANMHDRLDSIGGTCTVASVPGGGTTVTAVVPTHELSGRPT